MLYPFFLGYKSHIISTIVDSVYIVYRLVIGYKSHIISTIVDLYDMNKWEKRL